MGPPVKGGSDRAFTEQVRSELRSELAPAQPDPFATKLSDLVGGAGLPPAAGGKKRNIPAASALSGAAGGSNVGGSRAGGSRAASQLSVARSQHSVSQLSAARSQRSGVAPSAASGGAPHNDDADDMRSQLSAATSLSWRTPSTIRSSEPSAIARNKIAELTLRLELERVLRLQRETELEAQRSENAKAKAKEVR